MRPNSILNNPYPKKTGPSMNTSNFPFNEALPNESCLASREFAAICDNKISPFQLAFPPPNWYTAVNIGTDRQKAPHLFD